MSPPFEESPALAALSGLRHGFFGRQGGVSPTPFAALNVSEASNDTPANVVENRVRIAGALGIAADRLATLRQVHSNRVVTVSASSDLTARPEADALVTATLGLALGILTADCTPILLADPQARVIGAAHAGWGGAVAGIVATTVEAMAALGAEPGRIVAALGPGISAANYEVGPEFMAGALARRPDVRPHFSLGPGGREHFDVSGLVIADLRAAGVADIEVVGGCTYGYPQRYFSHRHATHHGTTTGRQLSVIGLV
jgi:YfiH family protein